MRNTTVNTQISQVSGLLSSLSRDTLRTLAKRHGIPTARYKRDMIQRLVSSDIQVSITLS